MIWIVGIVCFAAGAVAGLVLSACLFAAGRYDEWTDRRR